jgi:hypothetical protein
LYWCRPSGVALKCISQGHPCRRMWASCFCYHPRQESISQRFLLAFGAFGRG